MALKKRTLDGEIFNNNDRYLPYKTEADYMADVCSSIRLRIAGWMILDHGDDEGYEQLSSEQVRHAIDSAELHIRTRLAGSGDALKHFRGYTLCIQLGMSEFEMFVFGMAYALSFVPEFAA